jgi:hypothetical protein
MRFCLAMTALLVAAASPASAQYGGYQGYGGYGTGSNTNSHTIRPHINSNGTYNPGGRATNPNNTQLDNYGTRGNYNPYTGTFGTRSPRY